MIRRKIVQAASLFAMMVLPITATAALYPDPVLANCASAQEVLDVLSTTEDTTSAKILTCMGDLATFTNGIAAGLPFESGICLDTGGRAVFPRTSNTDIDLVKVVLEVNPNFSIGGHVTAFEFETEATSEVLSFHYAYASSEFDQASRYSDPFALLISVNGGEYENLAKLDNGMPVSIKNLRAGRNKQQNNYGDKTGSAVTSTEYVTVSDSPRMWSGSVIPLQSQLVDGITVEFCAEKKVNVGDLVKIKFVIADTGDEVFDSFVFIKADSLGFAEIAGAPIAYDATDVSKAGFKCNWYPVTGAVKYQVDVANDPDFQDLIVTSAETTETFYRVDGSYQQGQRFYYRVRAVGAKGTVSANSNVITVEIPTTEVAAPTISPASCGFTTEITATIVNNHVGATLHYTTDGMDPTIYSSTIPSGNSLTFTSNTTLKAIAVYKGVISPVAEATYALFTPPGAVSNVQATDGSRADGVLVTWDAPASLSPITAYEVTRKAASATSWDVLAANLTEKSYLDASATPGVDYTYRVRARNSSGWGAYGSDGGWRAVSLSVSPTTLKFGYQPASTSVTVSANTSWTISSNVGWATPTANGSNAMTVTVAKNTELSPRNGTITVTAGAGTAHPAVATVPVSQGKRPAKLTNLSIVGGTTSLEGGDSADFHAIATFDDGTTRDVTNYSDWNVTDGDSYGSVGAHDGHLVTVKTTDTDGSLTVKAEYTNSDYETVTKSDTVKVGIGFSSELLAPASVTISGDAKMFIGETKPYTATVIYNNGSKVDKTLDANMVWSVSPGAPTAEIKSGAAAELLTAYAEGSITLSVCYTEKTYQVAADKIITVSAPVTLPVAVDVESPDGTKLQPLAITASASANGTLWYGQTGITHDGEDAARSGHLSGEGWNRMQTVVTNAGTVTFWWKVASADPVASGLMFSIDGEMRAKIVGNKEWSELSFEVDAGTHTFAWVYTNGTSAAVQDAGFVDQIVWSPLDPPLAPVVQASDGTHTNRIAVSWSKPSSKRVITGYEVSRAILGSNEWTVVASDITGLDYDDTSADAGVDYTYRVRAKNDAGYGAYGSDDGWMGISLWVDPDAIMFGHPGGMTNVSVHASVPTWSLTPNAGWLHCAAGSQVSADPAVGLTERSGTVTVTAGTTSHSVNVTLAVVQAGIPPSYDVAFTEWNEFWRTKIQLATNAIPDGIYSPVSVFPKGAPLDISFGWASTTNSNAELFFMPSVGFKLYKAGITTPVYEWVAAGRDLSTGVAPDTKAWGGHFKCDILKVLLPGDYMLEAELDPAMEFDKDYRADNKAIFRFAVCDLSLSAEKDVFKEELGWTNVTLTAGNDFAQPPHAANRAGMDGTNILSVQFGPYVPMNGMQGNQVISSAKMPLDLVFLIDYTGSMGGCIGGLVNNIGTFIDQLLLGDPAKGIDPIDDIRIKIVGFNDTENYTYCDWFVEGAFTTDRNVLKKDLANLRNKCDAGSGNSGENSFDALYYLCKGWTLKVPANANYALHKETDSPFRGTNEASRVVLLFTDEPPHMPFSKTSDTDLLGWYGYSGSYSTLQPDDDGYGKNEDYCFDLLDQALRDAAINLTIIGGNRNLYGGYVENDKRYDRLVNGINGDPDHREYQKMNHLSTFAGNADLLRGLATNVAAKVSEVAKVVEPGLEAYVRGGGTLTFDWRNDSTAYTNNVLTFTVDGVTNMAVNGLSTVLSGGTTVVTNYGGAGTSAAWQRVTVPLGDGLHRFKWNYGKIGYDGAVTDCGIVSNVQWDPWKTELKVEPATVDVEWDGVPITQTNDENTVVFEVTCNSIWKVVELPEWMTLVQGAGNGNGQIIVSVHTNMIYDASRTGDITVRAGEYGLPSDAVLGTPEETVTVVQKPHPYIYDGGVHVLSVDVKPRWPWNSKVDIDFRVQTPWEGENTPVKVKVWGLNKEGGDLVDDYPTLKLLKECPAKSHVTEGFGEDFDNPKDYVQTRDEDGMIYITCPTSGLYRFTWDMGVDWEDVSAAAGDETGLKSYYEIWDKPNKFHTPAFAVRLQAQDDDGQSVSCESGTVRVDLRLASLNAIEYGEEDDDEINWAPAGGRVLTGWEKIGHPYGAIDPIPVDTRMQFPLDGWNCLDPIFSALGMPIPDEFAGISNRACVINSDKVAIEGGIITADTVWGVDKVHVIRDNVFVAPNATLTIAANAIVKFCDSTRIFVHEFDNIVGEGGRHNIVAKGATFVHGYSHVGGDTLYSTQHDLMLSDAGGSIFAQPIEDETRENDVVAWSGADEHTAICALELWCAGVGVDPDEEAGAVSIAPLEQTRFYSYGQKLGNLQRPSRDGCAFYGWYYEDPRWTDLGYTLDPDGYEASKTSFIYPDSIPFSLLEDEGLLSDSNNPRIYALFCAPKWVTNGLEKEDASDGYILLSSEKAVYNGTVQKPTVKEVWVGGLQITNTNYTVDYGTGDYIQAGTYSIRVDFAVDYENSPTATFTILPRSTSGSEIVFDPAELTYTYDLKGTSPENVVSTQVVLSDKTTVAPGGCTITWTDAAGRWPSPGDYTVVASFNGNYEGYAITNVFTVAVNHDYDYSHNAFSTASEAQTAAQAAHKRVLYIGGPEENPVVAYVKDLITNDMEMNEFIVNNYVVWTETNVLAQASAYAAFAAGMNSSELPLFAVLSPNDMTKPLSTRAGIVDGDVLLAWLQIALELPEDASSADITCTTPEITYTGSEVTPETTVAFAGTTIPTNDYYLVFSAPPVDVGTYTVKAKFKGKPDSNYTGETEASATFTIVPATLLDGFVSLDKTSVTYDGEMHKPVVSVSGGVPFDVDYGAGDYISAGTYTVRVSAKGNYTGTVEKSFTINPQQVIGAEVVLDQTKVEISKDPAAPIKPNVLFVRDGARTYVKDVDYTIGWGDGDYMSASTNTITATFIGNYTNTATATYVIAVVVAEEAQSFDPGTGVGIEVVAANEVEAIGKVTISVPANAESSGVSQSDYEGYFTKQAVYDANKGVWTVTAELNPEVVLPASEASELSEQVLSGMLPGGSESATIPARDGLFYRLEWASSVNGSYGGDGWSLAKGGSVTLGKPLGSKGAPAAFFKVVVTPAP